MPYKDPEKQKAYDRERKRMKRAKDREKEIEEQIRRGNINYGLEGKSEPFMSYEAYKRHFPDASFPTYLKDKMAYEKENRVEKVPKISKEDAFKAEGFDLWHPEKEPRQKVRVDRDLASDRALTDEELREHHRQADRLQEFLSSSEHPARPRESHWREDLAKLTEEVEDEQEPAEENPDKAEDTAQEEAESQEAESEDQPTP